MVNDDMPERVLLVGFMASGKSSTGKELASRLGWDFRDFDTVIAARAGKSVSRIFSEDGEAEFRRLESGVAEDLLARSNTVVASGGGWPAQPGAWKMVTENTMSIWLKVSLAVAVRRASEQGPTRPLLDGEGVTEQAAMLLLGRETAYSRARYSLDSEQYGPPELADEILKLMEREPDPKAKK
ncbi:MAG: shikimate kinase [Gemmatimonadetes bacterium]|nr:shikimate kinase [Gemmatimonadota bacterium]